MADGMMLGWKRECADADELLRLLLPDMDPADLRTEGGWINLPKVRTLLAERADGVRVLAARRETRAAYPSESEVHIAHREGYDEGWNDCLDALGVDVPLKGQQ